MNDQRSVSENGLPSASGEGAGQLVAFTLAEEEFGVDIGQVREIVRMPDVTPVPHSPGYVAGICNLRGNVLPVIDTRTRFSMNHDNQPQDTRLLVVETKGMQTGLVVDNVKEVMQVNDTLIEPPPAVCRGVGKEFLNGVVKIDKGKRLVLVLNLGELIQVSGSDQQRKESTEGGADVQVQEQEKVDEEQLVTFKVAHEEYAFQIEKVREIFRLQGVTAIPNVPAYVKGLFTLRNQLMPVLDLRSLLGIPSMEAELNTGIDRLIQENTLWLENLQQSIRSDAEFKGVTGIKESAFGKWIETFSSSNADIQNSLKLLKKDYTDLYRGAQNALRDSNQSKEEAIDVIEREVNGTVSAIGHRLGDFKETIKAHMTEDQRVLVVESGNVTVGYLVDSVNEVVRIPKSVIESTPAMARSERKELMGIAKLNEGKRLIMIMDETALVSRKDEYRIAEATGAAAGNQGAESPVSNTLKDQAMEEEQLVTFGIGNEEYGVAVMQVQEINRLSDVTSVPRAPSYVDGVTNLRGSVIPVINVRKFFGLEPRDRDDRTRIIIVDMAGVKTGLCVDHVNEVVRISMSSIEKTPAIITSGGDNDYMDGVCKFDDGKRMIIILNIERMLSDKELSVLSGIGEDETEEAAPQQPEPSAIKAKSLKRKTSAQDSTAVQ